MLNEDLEVMNFLRQEAEKMKKKDPLSGPDESTNCRPRVLW